MTVLSIDQIISLTMLEDPDIAVRALDNAIPTITRKILIAAQQRGEAVDWSTFRLEVDPTQPQFASLATIRTRTNTKPA